MIFLWRPTAIVYGVQRAGLYAAVALPMALVLGIVHIVNLAHGEIMMVGAYSTYFLSRTFGIDPYLALIPTVLVLYVIGVAIYKSTISRSVTGSELSQLILTFGIAMVLSQTMNLIATSQPRKLSLSYVSSSAQIGEISFGTYEFVFPVLAALMLIGMTYFLRKTKLGKAATAVGQNPRGSAVIGINVQRTYMIIFALSSALLGVVGSVFMTKMSIFPMVGGSYTMKSFCLVAMAGIGNLPMVVIGSLVLGIAESTIQAFPGGGGWSSLVFFVLIIAVILVRSFREKTV